MQKKTRLTVILGVVLVLGLAMLVWTTHRGVSGPGTRNNEKTYRGHGLLFSYSDSYLLREQAVDTTHRYHYSISLIENTPTNRDLLAGSIVGDGPTAITIDVFQNNLDSESLTGFVIGNSNSNFKLSDGMYTETTTTRGRVPALTYSWDGLYRGDSVVFLNESKKDLVMASVTYLTSEDPIRTDFKRLLGSLEFE